MGNYPETDDRNAAGVTDTDNIVVDLDGYRQWRLMAGRGIDANRRPRETEAPGAGARNAPIEDDHRN